MPNFRDLSGQRPAGIPRWSGNVSATVSHDVMGGITAYVRGGYDFATSTQLIETVPADISTFGNRSVTASVGFVNKPGRYEVMLFARNLTNYRTIIAAFPTVAQAGSYSGFPNQPRMYGVTLRARF